MLHPQQQQAPILAEQARSTSPCGCGCLIFLLVLLALGVATGSSILDAFEDFGGERVPAVPAEPPPPPAGAMTPAEACRAAGRGVAAPDAPGPRRVPQDLSRLLISDAPIPGFVDGERLVAEVDVAQWSSGLGDPARWNIAFERSGFRRGLQHFWSDSTGTNMMTHQVLEFRDEAGAQDLHRFYNKELCRRVDRVGRVPGVPGAVSFLRREQQRGWSNEATFVRGPLLIYVGLLSDQRRVYDPRLIDIARAADTRARP